MEGRIQLSHGAGGTIMNELLRSVILSNIRRRKVEKGVGLDEFDDGATLPLNGKELVVSSDAHTVNPIFFPGGDIGRLSVCGTVNDLAMMGARPIAMTDTVVVEEGFPLRDLERIFISINAAIEEVGMALIHGDFKVMPKGKLDGIVISTAGIGVVERGKAILDSGLCEGDKIIVTGPIGDHGIVIASLREGIEFKTTLISDVAPLWNLMEKAMSAGRITAAKDPTRGGLAMALNEMAARSNVSIWIKEEEIPIRDEVRGACEMLGMDPLELVCEGRAVLGVREEDAERVLEAIRSTNEGREARIIGHVKRERPGYVVMETVVGGKRVINPPLGEPTPRIC
ncbi:MAG: hydrogenase expression/formation protein HypE [Candidatus Methanomethylicia archaeon]|jgi:hydrogenase expression/formation protein HypE|nr:hydrogenase expression/formation protein HypE [Candidatus Methanomethylicia archaeon]MCQ5374216.1 hydrogenase expression/formation protein HypE [Candidatus Methanomethylicia archaeon]NHV60136.1 hydrogenase expression/formation protein HypE [Candidatus Verstraetearchaeota archaeon]